MSFNNSKDSDKMTNIDESSDSYDYLDSLMQDVMGTSEPEPANDSEDDITQEDPAHLDDNIGTDNDNYDYEESIIDVNQGIQKPSIEVQVEKPETSITPKRRVPLFQQIGVDVGIKNLGDETKQNTSINKKGDIREEEVVSDISSELEDINQRDNIEVKLEINSSTSTSKPPTINRVEPNSSDRNDSSEVDIDNMFDGMLEDLTSSLQDDPFKMSTDLAQDNLDPSVVVPLETPEMSEIIVTADGRTLADMLPGMRGGKKSVNQVVADIRNQANVVEVGDKKFSDNRYTKHVEVIDKEIEEQNKRRELSKKFLQRNAKFTEQEKIIMGNLGMSNEQFTKLMGSKELTKKEKEELIGLGRYGAEKHFKGRKYRTTVGDTAMLEFLVKFKFANTRILRWISNEPQGRTWRKLDRLRENGLVESQTIIGIPDLWGATQAGVAITGYSFDPGLRPAPKMTTVSSTMGINYIAACLWFNSVNVLNLEDFPAHNRTIALQNDGRDRVQGEDMVSELEIRSSLGKEINPNSTTMQTLGDERLYDVIASNVRTEIEKWEQSGKLGDSPEFFMGNEFMWILFPMSQLTLSYHVPDLVVKRERGPNGEPKSIAVEMERYEKSNDKYDKIMLAYKLDEHLYEKVVWITPNTRVARALEKAAKAVGFTRYSIIPIITETGVYDKQDIWMI